MGSRRPNFGSGRPNFGFEGSNLGPGRPDFWSGEPVSGSERGGDDKTLDQKNRPVWNHRSSAAAQKGVMHIWTDGPTNGWTNPLIGI